MNQSPATGVRSLTVHALNARGRTNPRHGVRSLTVLTRHS